MLEKIIVCMSCKRNSLDLLESNLPQTLNRKLNKFDELNMTSIEIDLQL